MTTDKELLFDGMTATQIALLNLYEFQEATGCGTAAEFLAQPKEPEQEPMAWLLEFVDEDCMPRRDVFYEPRHLQQHIKHNTEVRNLVCQVTPLYPSPPQSTWVGLTDEEAEAVNFPNPGVCYVYPSDWEEVGLPFVRAIEAKLKAKNERLEKNTHDK